MKKTRLMSMVLLSASALALAVPTLAAEPATEAVTVVQAQEAGTSLKLGYQAPHGDKAFASVVVALDGDTITDVVLDEYQFSDAEGFEAVPNADAGIGKGFAEGQRLFSKRENSDEYSAMMTEHADSTVSYDDNLEAIEDAVKGKTIEEVEALIEEVNALGEDGNISDVVTGATLVDAAGYLQAIVDTAKDGFTFSLNAGANVELEQELTQGSDENSFMLVTVATEDDTVLGVAIDEFQFLQGEDWEGVPNSDAGFGEGYAEGNVLASKLVNDEAYSAKIAEYAESTTNYAASIQAIADFAAGKTVDELKAAVEELNGLGEDGSVADVITGATLEKAPVYLQAIIDAAD